jgi:hypothetical protein
LPADWRKRLPRLDHDPDASARRWTWLLWTALVLALALAMRAAPLRNSVDALPWLSRLPLVALVLLWPLWRLGRLLMARVREAPLAPWHGRYYAFGQHQIRVLVDEDDRLLIVARDVFDALGMRGRGRHADRIRAVAGRDGLRTLAGSGEAVFTETGLQAWLERHSRPEVARFAHWLRTQVGDPHRRAVERGIRH